MRFKLIVLYVLFVGVNAIYAQGIFINRDFQQPFGRPQFNPLLTPLGLQWSRFIITGTGDQITVGHTKDAIQNEDLLLTKYNVDGAPIFNVQLNTPGNNNDYGVDLFEASNGDIFVCGTTDNGGFLNPYRALIARYDAAGLFKDSVTIGVPGLHYVATALKIHPTTGNLLVVIAAQGSGTGFDFMIVELNPTSLSTILNTSIYDYSNLDDIPLGIEIDASSSDVQVIGGSQSSTLTSAYAVAVFDGSTLGLISSSRTDLIGTPYDLATSYIKDSNGDIYITGKTYVGANANIKTVKIYSNYTIAWTSTLDVHGAEDVGSTIAYDAVNSEVVVGGYATKTNSKTEMICLRYNATTGATVSTHRQSAEDPSGDAIIKKLVTVSNGNVYFIGGEKGTSGFNQTVVGRINSNGLPSWQKKISITGQDIVPSDIDVTNDGIFTISVRDSLTFNAYVETKFEELELDTTTKYNSTSGIPVWPKKQLIVRFQPTALDSSTIDDELGTKISEFGDLSDFMTFTAYTQLTNALTEYCRPCNNIKAVKVFPGLTTTFTTTANRLDQSTEVPDFWTTLLLEFPASVTIEQAHNAFKTLPSIVGYSHPNYIGQLHGPPNDSLYLSQTSLDTSATYPNAHINVEEAWEVIPSGGKSFVRGGVFDSGVFWKHKDFGYDGVSNASSKIVDGWDFNGGGVPMKTLPNGGDSDDHGTPVAGIIGAIRNNVKGIAGIAGGNDSSGNKGVSLYSFKVSGPTAAYNQVGTYTYLNNHANALIFGSQWDTSTTRPKPYTYGLHFINNSNGFPASIAQSSYVFIDTNITLLTEAVHFANRMNVTFVASRGNFQVSQTNTFNLPSGVDDDWVLSVTGSGTDGYLCHNSTAFITTPVNCANHTAWGYEVDVAAPAAIANILTTGAANNYVSFGASSGAAPHVSGVVGLLMSYLNNPNGQNDYNNLAPEDCEQIIQRSAKDDNLNTGYDQFMGWGRLDAGKALKMVQKPFYTLHHFGTKFNSYTSTKNVQPNIDTIILTERYRNKANVYFPKGKYVVKAFRIEATVTHNLANTDTIKAFWPRPSMSEVLEIVKNKKLRPRERDTILSINNSQALLRGFIYQVWDTLGNAKGWWPFDTSLTVPSNTSLFEYSVLTRNYASRVDINEKTKNVIGVDLFPNPTTGEQTIIIENEKPGNLTVELVDVTGRVLKTIYKGKTVGDRTVLYNYVGNLPNSLYIYIIRLDDKVLNKKFIKQG